MMSLSSVNCWLIMYQWRLNSNINENIWIDWLNIISSTQYWTGRLTSLYKSIIKRSLLLLFTIRVWIYLKSSSFWSWSPELLDLESAPVLEFQLDLHKQKKLKTAFQVPTFRSLFCEIMIDKNSDSFNFASYSLFIICFCQF